MEKWNFYDGQVKSRLKLSYPWEKIITLKVSCQEVIILSGDFLVWDLSLIFEEKKWLLVIWEEISFILVCSDYFDIVEAIVIDILRLIVV